MFSSISYYSFSCRDFVRIYTNLDRPDVNENSKYEYELCGSIAELEQKTYYSSDRALILELHTDSSSQEKHTGFRGVFEFKDKSK